MGLVSDRSVQIQVQTLWNKFTTIWHVMYFCPAQCTQLHFRWFGSVAIPLHRQYNPKSCFTRINMKYVCLRPVCLFHMSAGSSPWTAGVCTVQRSPHNMIHPTSSSHRSMVRVCNICCQRSFVTNCFLSPRSYDRGAVLIGCLFLTAILSFGDVLLWGFISIYFKV